jgi:glycosyltransferase involved in cell wall biosynthesis
MASARHGRAVVTLVVTMLAPFGIRPKGTLVARMLPLAQALVRQGALVRIVAPPVLEPRDAGRVELLDGVEVRHTALPRWPGVAAHLQAALLMRRAALTHQPDVIHLFKPKGYGGLAVRAGLGNAALVVDSDDWEGRGGWNDLAGYPPLARRVFAWQEQDLPRRAGAVTVASRTLQTQMWGFGIAPERVFYVPNGVAAPRGAAARGGGGRRVAWYTRFWECPPESMVAIWARVHAARRDTTLVVIGRGEHGEEHRFLEAARQAGIADSIDYLGWLEPAAIPAVLATIDLALVPVSDTLVMRARASAKLLELVAAGIPLVASRVGEAAEYLRDSRGGVLVPPDDAAAFADATLLLLSDPAQRRMLLERAAGISAEYSWDALAPAVIRAWQVARAGPAPAR